jgi:hypothetical protein
VLVTGNCFDELTEVRATATEDVQNERDEGALSSIKFKIANGSCAACFPQSITQRISSAQFTTLCLRARTSSVAAVRHGSQEGADETRSHLVPHRSLHLERASTGNSAQAVKAFLDAGGSPMAVVSVRGAEGVVQLPILHNIAYESAHPHRELAESVQLLIDAGADVNVTSKSTGPESDDERSPLMNAAERACCAAVTNVFLGAGADPCARSSLRCIALHTSASISTTGSKRCHWQHCPDAGISSWCIGQGEATH